MDCPACQTSNRSGQKFCGACGRKLEVTCVQCGAANPPQYKFCGECGSNLASAGAVVLARSGLIVRADQKALDLLGHRDADVQGKPFSLFVNREDLVVFFSHLNDLHSDSTKASFEITLKNGDGKSVHTLVEGSVDERLTENPGEIHLSFSEVEDHRQTSAQMQYQQDLLGLIFSVTENISAVSRKHLDLAIDDALKKICLFAKADHCFIYDVNRRLKRLEPYCHWSQASISASNDGTRLQSVPMVMVKRTIVRMRRSQTYVIDDVAQLAPAERYELLAWHKADLGAVMCHLIYKGKQPIGVIGLAKNRTDEEWSPDCVALLKFFGQFVANQRPKAPATGDAVEPKHSPPGPATASKKRSRTATAENVIDISAKKVMPRQPPEKPQEDRERHRHRPGTGMKTVPEKTRPMLLEKLSGSPTGTQQPVFLRDDGLILLICPRCGLQVSVSAGRFNKLGNAVRVDCQCRKQFTAVLEKRRSFRKSVRLDGYFSLKDNLRPAEGSANLSGAMMVKDLSKTGLRFTARKANLVHTGDLLMVRFNLDNSNKALIHKAARVVSVTRNEVGCQFEGSDSYDITLGFYFI